MCKQKINSGILINNCTVKLLSRDCIRINVEVTSNRTLKAAFIHYMVYYKYSNNEYRLLGINRWEDFCGFMNGDKKNIALSRIYPNFQSYTNLNHTCPYKPGFYFLHVSNLTYNSITPAFLVPAGRYRIDAKLHEGFEGELLAEGSIFGSVSDRRIDVF